MKSCIITKGFLTKTLLNVTLPLLAGDDFEAFLRADCRRNNRCCGPRSHIWLGLHYLRRRNFRCNFMIRFLWILRFSAKRNKICTFLRFHAKCIFTFSSLLLRSVIFLVMRTKILCMQWTYLSFLVLSYDCANLLFMKRHPPLLHGWEDERRGCRSRACKFCEAPPPPSLDLRGATNFFARDFVFRLWHKRILLALESLLVKDFPALYSSV